MLFIPMMAAKADFIAMLRMLSIAKNAEQCCIILNHVNAKGPVIKATKMIKLSKWKRPMSQTESLIDEEFHLTTAMVGLSAFVIL